MPLYTIYVLEHIEIEREGRVYEATISTVFISDLLVSLNWAATATDHLPLRGPHTVCAVTWHLSKLRIDNLY